MPRRVLFAIRPRSATSRRTTRARPAWARSARIERLRIPSPHRCPVQQAARSAGWTATVVDGAGSATAAVARSVAETETNVLPCWSPRALRKLTWRFSGLLATRAGSVRAEPPVLLFGPSAGLAAHDWVTNGPADTLLAGEPEAAIASALESTGSRHAGCPRAAARPAGRMPVRWTASTPDLDTLPFPAWDLVPWQPYELVSLLSGRGCPADVVTAPIHLTPGRHVPHPERRGGRCAEWTWLTEEVRPPVPSSFAIPSCPRSR